MRLFCIFVVDLYRENWNLSWNLLDSPVGGAGSAQAETEGLFRSAQDIICIMRVNKIVRVSRADDIRSYTIVLICNIIKIVYCRHLHPQILIYLVHIINHKRKILPV